MFEWFAQTNNCFEVEIWILTAVLHHQIIIFLHLCTIIHLFFKVKVKIRFWPYRPISLRIKRVSKKRPGGGTDQERGYGDVWPWRPPFHASPATRKGPISSKRVSSQDPLLRKFGNFSLNSLNFHPNFSSQAPKFGNFQLTSPQIWKFSAHKPPNLEIFNLQAPKFGNFPLTSPPFQRQMSVRKPHTLETQATHPTWKKVECSPPPEEV